MRKTLLQSRKILSIFGHVLSWHMNYYIKGQGFPLACGVFLTNRCNLQCKMCTIWTDRDKATLTLDQVKTVIDAITPGLCYISFSGGEPLLVDNIVDIISYSSKKIPYVHLVTNGFMMNKNLAVDLAKAGLTEISVSLDGDKAWHNELRNSNRSYDAAVNAIECLKRYAPEITIVANSVIFPDKLDQIRKAVEITKKLNIQHKVQPVNKHFLFDNNIAAPYKINFNGTDISIFSQLIDDLKRNPRIINSNAYLAMIPYYFTNVLYCPMIKKRCLIPRFYLELSPYGRLSPCMIATGWKGLVDIDTYVKQKSKGSVYAEGMKRLESCRKCEETMYICYWEPMINFPLWNFVKYSLVNNRL